MLLHPNVGTGHSAHQVLTEPGAFIYTNPTPFSLYSRSLLLPLTLQIPSLSHTLGAISPRQTNLHVVEKSEETGTHQGTLTW